MRKTFLAGIYLLIIFVFTQPGYGQAPLPTRNNPDAGKRENPNSVMVPSANAVEPEAEPEPTNFRPMAEIRREIREKIKLTDDEKENYKKLAGDKKASVIRLIASFSCSTTRTIDISDPRCAENPDLAVVSYYSFRLKDYGESPWTDLNLIEDEVSAGNKWHTVGLLVDLGETMEFGKLSPDTEELKALWELPSAKTFADKAKQKKELETGITAGKLFISSKMKMQLNHTYMLRTIAYRIDGGFMVLRGGFNWYNSDTLFIFRPMAVDAGGTATIVWRKISQRVAPILTEKEKGKSE